MACGILIFRSVGEALKAGFELYERTVDGYVVRIRIDGSWQIALVRC